MQKRWCISLFDFILYLILIFLSLSVLLSLDYHEKDAIVLIQFFLIGIYTFWRAASSKENINIYRMVYIFSYIFFFLAPMQQYTSEVIFWQGNGLNLWYTDRDYVRANIAILLFLICFDLMYRTRRRKRVVCKEEKKFCLANSTLFLLLLISTFAFLILGVTNNITSSSILVSNSAINSQLLYILKFIPVASFMVYILHYQKNLRTHNKIYLTLITLECLIIFFPLWGNTARFFLFGAYLVVYALFFSNSKRKKSLIFSGFVILFSFLFSDLRYIESISDIGTIAINFNHVDFDAYQMLMACMKYVDNYGVCFGMNFLSAFAFLVPRSIWSAKLISTGAIVAEAFGSWYTNVSMPLVGESYFAFGWIGIVVIALVFGYIAKKIDGWSNSENYLRRCIFCLISGMTIYIMRGALLAACAFVLGIMLGIIFICYICKVK